MKQKKSAKTQLLLLEDVINLGRKGELASAKPGFVRNYLLPQKKAVIADKRTIRMQEQLQVERAAQSAKDKKDSQALAARLKEKTLTTKVKNDSQGHLYGSVASSDIVKILEEQESVTIERKNVILPKPFKTVGTFDVHLRLKEDVAATFKLKIEGETKVQEPKPKVEVVDEEQEEALAAAEGSEETSDDLPMRSEREKEMKEELEERSKE
ncbi:50S ribosomal protein L9 [Candidatus Neptunichlamydia sp. REUL1]|uniref:50S ribosomal protein L9 n=1 Tax=Candidatus Neptunichlamydia sp. REUL1 TaxID=3064277 RepID=UPI002930712A|nr:50S ribosomal protein L9 [Candidatus Neptunochlamydia sp. REUL1]